MRSSFLSSLPLLASLFHSSSAQHEFLNIPEVDAYVHMMETQFAEYLKPLAASPTAPHVNARAVAAAAATSTVPAACSYWLDNIRHQGISAFNSNSSYQVYRNVMNFGAKGDGVTDDTAAINLAISSGGRFGPSSGTTSTTTPAIVYLPPGTYLISSPIIDYYYTQIIGNPNCMPVLKATANFTGTGGSYGLIDGNVNSGFGATNLFYRQVRNLVFDMTGINGLTPATGIHWPTSQATSIQNCVFKMSSIRGTTHQGIFIENGSGGFMADIVFQGGLYGLNAGNQQFTMRNLTFSGTVVAISQIWNWGWTYQGLNINNCTLGFNMSQGGSSAQSVAAAVIIDSVFTNTRVGVSTAYSNTSQPDASGSLVLENVQFRNVPVAVQGPGGATYLAGTTGSMTVAGYAQGHRYNPFNNPVQGTITPPTRPAALVSGTSYYYRSKPQYQTLPASSFLSARSLNATGNGVTDDTAALQRAINMSVSNGMVLFVDAGTYRITSTLLIPPGARIVGESYSVIMSSGSFFNNINSPQPVVQIGNAGQSGRIEWSDMIVSTQGQQQGAILIAYRMVAPAGSPTGIWDVHTRIGGFIGSNVQANVCPATSGTTVTASNLKTQCIAAFMAFHAAPASAGLYLENNWFWTADHDIDANYGGGQVSVYTGRGVSIESQTGPTWMYGVSAEHFSKYQFQFYNTSTIVVGQIQTETPYYQPNPNATLPFPPNSVYNDPIFPTTQYNPPTTPNANAYGLRVVAGKQVFMYGVGLYSFFNNFSTACSNQGNGETCQSRTASFENNSQVLLYDLHTVGTTNMVTRGGSDYISYVSNQAGFTDEVILFRINI